MIDVFSNFHETKEDFEELLRYENPLITIDYRLEDSQSDILSLYLLIDGQSLLEKNKCPISNLNDRNKQSKDNKTINARRY